MAEGAAGGGGERGEDMVLCFALCESIFNWSSPHRYAMPLPHQPGSVGKQSQSWYSIILDKSSLRADPSPAGRPVTG